MSVFNKRPRGVALLVMLFSAGLAGSGALGQAADPGQARNDGKAFAAEIATRAQDAAQEAPTAETLPNFDASPSQSSLFDDPDALAALWPNAGVIDRSGLMKPNCVLCAKRTRLSS